MSLGLSPPSLVIIILFLLLLCDSVHAKKYERIQSRRRLFGRARCATCQALFSELLLEVHRHNLHAHGEEDILDSVEAACLGVVQNYTMIEVPPWVEFSPQDERLASREASKSSSMETIVQNAMLMKETCIQVSEELGNELSEGVWRRVKGRVQERAPSPPAPSPPHSLLASTAVPCYSSAALAFCSRLDDSGCPKAPKKAGSVVQGQPRGGEHGNGGKKKRKMKKKKTGLKETPATPMNNRKNTSPLSGGASHMPSIEGYSELLRTLDVDGSLSNMLLREQDNPGLWLPEDQQHMLRRGKVALRCDVCRAVVDYVYDVEPGYVLASESSVVSILEDSCIGPPDTSMPSLLGITPPPLPALWTDLHRISWPHISTDDNGNGQVRGGDATSLAADWFLIHVQLPLEPRPADPREYRQRLSSRDHLEKLILTESCKLAVRGNEDKIATRMVRGEIESTCEHVCGTLLFQQQHSSDLQGMAGDRVDL